MQIDCTSYNCGQDMTHGQTWCRNLNTILSRKLQSKISACCRRQAIRAQYSTNYSSFDSRVIFSGIQPTGVPHLGNYLGALQQWKRLQDEATSADHLFFSVVDLHAITVRHDAAQLRKWKRETLAALLATGLKPDRCTIFFQSAVRIAKWKSWAKN